MRILHFIAITAIPFLLSACGGREESASVVSEVPSPGVSSSWPATRTTDRGNFDVVLQPESDEIERNQHFSLGVALSAKNGDTGDLEVVVDADMPAHQHGMNTKPEIFAVGTSQYRVEGLVFHMSGDWVITVDVSRGGETERASFPVTVE